VIYRGQTKNEIDQFSQMTDEGIQSGLSFLSFTTFHMMMMTAFVYVILFASIWYLIKLKFNKKIDSTIFITFFTILLLYRDKILNAIQNMPDYLEFIGRLEYILDDFNAMLGKKQNIHDIITKTYIPVQLEFKKIQFRNVSFTYTNKQTIPIFDHLTIDVDTYHKIIGMTGLSGKGKSSFAKLILRLYEPTSGAIYIDGVDITTIDPNYIRENITYVNQNSRLFDKKIIENMVYGCNSLEACQNHLQEIMRYPKIRQLYQNVDVINSKAGSLGENLSGGQRQVVNIISGLINPSKILILDEPTNALDSDLKGEVLAMIQHFRQYKQCIIIITHDRDVYSLFDETLQI
jgi:ABC-type multidrug transport system fused ATPase/permease subunit